MNRFVSRRRVSSSGARRIDDGCTVASTSGASGDATNAPRCAVTLNCRPSSACAAVAPRQTIARGLTSAISVSSHGRQAAISRGVRLLVDAPLAARLPLEVLHDVGDVDGGAIDAGLRERAVEQLAGRADERMAGEIFRVARLLADQHQLGACAALRRTPSASRASRDRSAWQSFARRRARVRSVGRDRESRSAAALAVCGIAARRVRRAFRLAARDAR